MHWVGGAFLDPKTVRTARHWFVRYMATIIGPFLYYGDGPLEEQSANVP
jgi:hypothetical protein